MQRWPHQISGVQQVITSIQTGDRHICLTSPTGGGKSVMIVDLLEWAASQGWPAILYTNRKLLTEQMIGTLTKHGIPFGVRASGFPELENFDAPIQIASLQTEAARVHKSMKWLPHRSKLVLIDEAHLQKSSMAKKAIEFHDKNDAACVGITATPIGIANLYPDRLIIAGTTSQLRACGALVPCDVYAPSEFDTKNLKPQKTGEFSVADIRKYIWSKTIYGHVYDHWKNLNPDARPALLFAPGVAEAVGFAEKFHGEGVGAASIDGEDVWVDGKTYSSSREAREEVLARFKAGEIKVLCNRFVLREGIDLPEVYHGILATPIGSVVSYVQIVGRILRASPATPSVILQDHGGNWWRHGSPNADRDWASVYDVQERLITERRQENMREKKEPEPIVCAKCGAVRMKGPDCHQCGYRQDKKSRMVIQKDGKLKSMEGDIFKPRTVKMMPNTEQIWERCYHRAKNSKNGMTFKQAVGLMFYEEHYWPPKNLPLMPIEPLDWERKVRDVPREKLIQKQPKETAQ